MEDVEGVEAGDSQAFHNLELLEGLGKDDTGVHGSQDSRAETDAEGDQTFAPVLVDVMVVQSQPDSVPLVVCASSKAPTGSLEKRNA